MAWRCIRTSPTPARCKGEIENLRRVMRLNGDGATPLYVTEMGWGSASFESRWERGPHGQARELDRAFAMLTDNRLRWHIGGVWWFSWTDAGGLLPVLRLRRPADRRTRSEAVLVQLQRLDRRRCAHGAAGVRPALRRVRRRGRDDRGSCLGVLGVWTCAAVATTVRTGRQMDLIVISVLAVALAALCGWLVVLLLRGRAAQHRFEILGEVASGLRSRRLAGGDTRRQSAISSCPRFADFCAIDVIEGDRPRRVARAGRAGADSRCRARAAGASSPRCRSGWSRATMAIRWTRVSSSECRRRTCARLAHDDGPDLEFLRGIGVRSAITLALQARGQVTGALTLGVAWSGRRYRPATRISPGSSLAASPSLLTTADSSRTSSGPSGNGPRSPRPSSTGSCRRRCPTSPGWSLAAMYRPAGAENEVGGDFYDAFRVPGGWMLVIGDVTGRGAEAASITALARYTLRTAAVLTNDPRSPSPPSTGRCLRAARTALCSVAALALSDDPAQPVRLAVAGHPPPLLVDGEAVSEVAGSDPVLGAFADVEWGIEQASIEPGQQIVLVTDGITEAVGERGVSVRSGCGRSSPGRAIRRMRCSDSRTRCTPSPPARSTTTWQFWRSPAPGGDRPAARISRREARPARRWTMSTRPWSGVSFTPSTSAMRWRSSRSALRRWSSTRSPAARSGTTHRTRAGRPARVSR